MSSFAEFLISRVFLVWRVFLGRMELLAVSNISDIREARSWSIVGKHVVKLYALITCSKRQKAGRFSRNDHEVRINWTVES